MLRVKTERTWFSDFSCPYDIRPGNGAGLFLQPQNLYGAVIYE